jgi:hypothetical protein
MPVYRGGDKFIAAIDNIFSQSFNYNMILFISFNGLSETAIKYIKNKKHKNIIVKTIFNSVETDSVTHVVKIMKHIKENFSPDDWVIWHAHDDLLYFPEKMVLKDKVAYLPKYLINGDSKNNYIDKKMTVKHFINYKIGDLYLNMTGLLVQVESLSTAIINLSKSTCGFRFEMYQIISIHNEHIDVQPHLLSNIYFSENTDGGRETQKNKRLNERIFIMFLLNTHRFKISFINYFKYLTKLLYNELRLCLL